MSFGYQVLGFGTGATGPVLPGQLIQTGIQTTNLTDPRAGDLVIAFNGNLVNNTNLASTGFTNIEEQQSSVNWSPGDATYYLKGRIQYRIMDGNETQFTGTGFTFQQYRFHKPISSVTMADRVYSQSTLGGSFQAYTPTSTFIGCLRVVGRAGYNCDVGGALSSNGGYPNITQGGMPYSKFYSYDDFESGTYSMQQTTWRAPGWFYTIKCNV